MRRVGRLLVTAADTSAKPTILLAVERANGPVQVGDSFATGFDHRRLNVCSDEETKRRRVAHYTSPARAVA